MFDLFIFTYYKEYSKLGPLFFLYNIFVLMLVPQNEPQNCVSKRHLCKDKTEHVRNCGCQNTKE